MYVKNMQEKEKKKYNLWGIKKFYQYYYLAYFGFIL